jgi:hypothetical protein
MENKTTDNFKSNYGMFIPRDAVIFQKPKPVSRWKQLLCLLIGHKWGFAGITYMGPSFPRTCSRCKVTKWFDKPNLRMRIDEWVDKTLDKLWVPLCKIGIHRFTHHYLLTTYWYDSSAAPSNPLVEEQRYRCSCCKKTKTKLSKPMNTETAKIRNNPY